MLSGTDHHSICKFGDQANGSLVIVALEMLSVIKTIRKGLSAMDLETSGSPRHRVRIPPSNNVEQPDYISYNIYSHLGIPSQSLHIPPSDP